MTWVKQNQISAMTTGEIVEGGKLLKVEKQNLVSSMTTGEIVEGGKLIRAEPKQNQISAMIYNAMLEGFVYDAITGEPIPNATIYLPNLNISVKTDDRGRFRILNPKIGKSTLIVEAPDYKRYVDDVTVKSGVQYLEIPLTSLVPKPTLVGEHTIYISADGYIHIAPRVNIQGRVLKKFYLWRTRRCTNISRNIMR